jgi:hypothetical protein
MKKKLGITRTKCNVIISRQNNESTATVAAQGSVKQEAKIEKNALILSTHAPVNCMTTCCFRNTSFSFGVKNSES